MMDPDHVHFKIIECDAVVQIRMKVTVRLINQLPYKTAF